MSYDADTTLADIRSEVCDTVLKWTVVLGVPAVALSLSRIFEFGFLPIMAVHTLMVSALAGTYVFRRRFSFAIRAGLIVLMMFVVGVAGHLSFGTPTRIEFFVSACIMATVFFGERTGIRVAILSVGVIGAIYAAISFHVVPHPMVPPPLSPTNWIANTASLIVAALAPLIAVNRYRRQLHEENQRATSANKAKSQFLATMSHELRTPMTAILGMADLLASDELTSAAKEKVRRISDAGRSLLGLLNDLLDFSKIESEKMEVHPVAFSPRGLVSDVCSLFAPLAAQKGILLTQEVSRDVGDEVVADAGHIRQAVLNLVSNAVKFTQRGAVTVRCFRNDGLTPNHLVIEVQDTGIGINTDALARLFKPFVQANQTRDRKYGGTGLGLTITRRLVELIGGTVTVRSKQDVGTTFAISVPVAAAGSATLSEAQENVTKAAPAVRTLRLLVAEDNETISFLLQTMLRKWGHKVDAVSDGLAAVNAVRANTYDCVLMDMHMPGMDGVDALREIRANGGPKKDIPIIAVTADIAPEHREIYLAAGANAVVGKPVNWPELTKAMNRHCASATHEHQNSQSTPPREEAIFWDKRHLVDLSDQIGPESVVILLQSFSKSLRDYIGQLRSPETAHDIFRAKRLAHAIKGLCRQFGAVRAADLAAGIETDGVSLEEIALELPALIRELAAVDRAVSLVTSPEQVLQMRASQ
ncbi:MAG: ATP-binding protein [Rhodospirillaceae bacterium]